MIVVDTSALMAIVLKESNADDCIAVLADDTDQTDLAIRSGQPTR